MKVGHAARREAVRRFSDTVIGEIPYLGRDLERLRLEAAVRAAGGVHRLATTANLVQMLPYRVSVRTTFPLQIVLFLQTDMRQSAPGHYPNGSNHSISTAKVLEDVTGSTCCAYNIVWRVLPMPLQSKATPFAVGGEGIVPLWSRHRRHNTHRRRFSRRSCRCQFSSKRRHPSRRGRR